MRTPGHRPAAAPRQLDVLLRQPSPGEKFARVRREVSAGQSPDGPVHRNAAAPAVPPAGRRAPRSARSRPAAGEPPPGSGPALSPVAAAAGEPPPGSGPALSPVAAQPVSRRPDPGPRRRARPQPVSRQPVSSPRSARSGRCHAGHDRRRPRRRGSDGQRVLPGVVRPAADRDLAARRLLPGRTAGRIDRFAVTVLASGQRMVAGRFAAAGRPGARLLLDDVPHHRGALSGALIPDEGLLALECEAVSRVPAGDHLLVISRVQSFLPGNESGAPLIRFRGRYPADLEIRWSPLGGKAASLQNAATRPLRPGRRGRVPGRACRDGERGLPVRPRLEPSMTWQDT